jgi:hypothetical protein
MEPIQSSLPKKAINAQQTQINSDRPGDSVDLKIDAGVMKIPEPIMFPIT